MPDLRHAPPECGPVGGTPETALIEPVSPVGLVGVRADLSDDALRKVLEKETGLPLPGVRQAALRHEDCSGWYWMAPDELLLRVPRDHAATAVDALESALAGVHFLVGDLSDSRAFFRISGPAAREVIAKGAPVDLHPDAFQRGMFRRTHVAGIAAAFSLVAEDPDTFELFCSRSYAHYLRDWLVNAARPGSVVGIYAPSEREEPGRGTPSSKSTSSSAT